ncbi:MAG: uridine monophosphate kinase [Brevinema sp.]
MKRVLIKLSGEMLGEQGGIAHESLMEMSSIMKTASQFDSKIGVVIGAGNIMRGSSTKFLDRVRSDAAGMLGTAINAMALQNCLEKDFGVKSCVLGAFAIDGMFEKASPDIVCDYFKQGYLIIFAGGTGSPFFSTDTAGVLKALEINADLLIKATKVDGVYDKDPKKYADAVKFDQISYQEVLDKNLSVMDLTAISLAMEQSLPIRVTELTEKNITALLKGQSIGTLVSSYEN